MRWPATVLITALTGLAIAPFPQPPASASCPAPYLEDAGQLVLHRGLTITVEGRAFVKGCRDSMSCEVGCGSCDYDSPPEVPMEDVAIQLVQGDRTWELERADAGTAEENRLGHLTWTFTVPDDLRRGPARLLVEHAEPEHIRIRIR